MSNRLDPDQALRVSPMGVGGHWFEAGSHQSKGVKMVLAACIKMGCAMKIE